MTVDIRDGDDVDRLQPNGIADCNDLEFTRNLTYSDATGSLAFSFSENFSGEHPQDSTTLTYAIEGEFFHSALLLDHRRPFDQ